MREDYPRERTAVHIWLICALVAMYVLQHVLLKLLASTPTIYDAFAYNTYLSVDGIRHYKLWTLVTYSLCHDPGNLLHILFAVLGLYFMGRELESTLGPRRFLLFYFASVLGGGLAYTAAHWASGGAVLGSSAGITGLLILFVCLNPDRPITFLFLFFPITLPKAKYLGYAVGLLEIFGCIFYEMVGGGDTIAYSAHLGGIMVALLFRQFFLTPTGFALPSFLSKKNAQIETPPWTEKARKIPPAPFKVNLTDRQHLRAEVDRILDKINSKGFASLTAEEKRTLDEARDLLGKN
jgi:membrane associated rhomboid family serine protease